MRVITKKELNIILEKHAKWLNSYEDGERANLSGANLLGSDLSEANLSEANLSEAYLSGANLSRADLSGATLLGANLSRANLSGTDLSGATLLGANFSRANLSGTDLSGANLQHTSILSFTLGKHLAFYHEGYLKIGCVGKSLEEWEKTYVELGEKNQYTDKEIKRYGEMFNFIRKLV